MKILRVLFFCFLSATTGFTEAQPDIWIVPEGGNFSLYNYFLPGSTKFFCKKKCETAEDILIKTDGTTAQSGKYSLQYRNASSGRGRLLFTITRMTKSDSGMYRFGLGKSLVPDSFSDIEARVSNELNKNSFRGLVRAHTVDKEIRFACANAEKRGKRKFFCKNQCKKEGEILINTTNDKAQSGRYSMVYTAESAFGMLVTITNLTTADTGQYRCGYGNPLSPDSYQNENIFVIDDSNPSASTPQTTTQSLGSTSTPSSFCPELSIQSTDYFVPLIVCASLVGLLLLVVFFLLFWKKRRSFGFNTREKADNTNVKFSVNYEKSFLTSGHDDMIS